jgi:hypothetical protein
MTAKKFRNFSKEDFTWKYDGIPYTFPAGQETYMEDFKADHFAKHLIDRELNRTKTLTHDVNARRDLLALCFPPAEEVTPLEALNINEEVKAKKGKKKEAEFEDLDVKPKKTV